MSIEAKQPEGVNKDSLHNQFFLAQLHSTTLSSSNAYGVTGLVTMEHVGNKTSLHEFSRCDTVVLLSLFYQSILFKSAQLQNKSIIMQLKNVDFYIEINMLVQKQNFFVCQKILVSTCLVRNASFLVGISAVKSSTLFTHDFFFFKKGVHTIERYC